MITHAKPGYARLWRQVLKFEIIEGKEAVYEGHPEPYIELRKNLTIPENAISPASDAMLLFREEGRWDMPSKFEEVVK